MKKPMKQPKPHSGKKPSAKYFIGDKNNFWAEYQNYKKATGDNITFEKWITKMEKLYNGE